MQNIKIIPITGIGFLGNNAYLVHKDGECDAVLIDAPKNYEKILNVAKTNNLKVRAVLLTHGHFDHIGSARKFESDGARIYIHVLDNDKLHSSTNLSKTKIPETVGEINVCDGDVINECGMEFRVMHTPGHSKGSVCYLIDNAIFSGDTLFRGSFGRTDFYDGEFLEIRSSVGKILNLDENYTIYPGHGEFTTVKDEKIINPLR